MNDSVSEHFRDLLKVPDDKLDVARAALQLAQMHYPGINIDAYVGKLDEMATTIGDQLVGRPAPEDALRAINQHLFADLRFSGNTQDYYDPRNSYLNEVLDRRLGIPISLSVVYLEVGWRLGLGLAGVSFPGHFLVKLSVDAGEIVLDPYGGGISLGKEELELRLLGAVAPTRAPGQFEIGQYLEPAPRREILHRMLRNLKGIFLQAENDDRALSIMQHMLVVMPEDRETLRDRGLLYSRIGCFSLAVEDLSRYLGTNPDGDDVEEVRSRLVDARRNATRLH